MLSCRVTQVIASQKLAATVGRRNSMLARFRLMSGGRDSIVSGARMLG
jgi:hypothetical protein